MSKTKTAKLKLGDYFQIPLRDRFAYGHYIYLHETLGYLVKIFDYFTANPNQLNEKELATAPGLFPPVFTFLAGAISIGRWRVVGNSPVQGFELPKFLNYWSGESQYEARMWFLWDGAKTIKLGPSLPNQYKRLEIEVIWSLESLETRIESGINPYEKMILEG